MNTHSGGRPLTGRAVFSLFALGFGVIIAVNVALAVSAVRTFPGLEVANSYIASQDFDARRAAQQRLGWSVSATYEPGRLSLSLLDRDGARVLPGDLSVRLGRPTEEADDLTATIDRDLVAAVDLRPGRWRLDVAATAPDGTLFEKRLLLSVPR